MTRNRFRAIRANFHFSSNEETGQSKDRFYKIRPLFTLVIKEFLKIPAYPINSIDEVMVLYKVTMAGNLRQYNVSKPDKWGYKLICRGSINGFIHDIL